MENPFNSIKSTFVHDDQSYTYFSLPALQSQDHGNIEKLPYCYRILLEGMLRNCGSKGFNQESVRSLLNKASKESKNVLFLPNRVLLQDFTGIPVLNDLAALRSALDKRGIDPKSTNPVIRTDLVVDHSLQVDYAGCEQAAELNEKIEFQRNLERYQFLRWGEQAFENLRIIPPGNGIIHQINLEYLADVVSIIELNGERILAPDSVLGTDSHTPMINGLGVVGWGVGGIEALAAMLGYPIEFTPPPVIGLHLSGALSKQVTATDLTLTITSRLREYGVVGKFVEVCGEGVANLRLEDRAMIANMTPESGATITYFPVDAQTLDYLRFTGRNASKIGLVEAYFKTQHLFRENNAEFLTYDDMVEIDLDQVEPMLAGPKRPFDLIPVKKVSKAFPTSLVNASGHHGFGLSKEDVEKTFPIHIHSEDFELTHGAVILAAITSCTNTSNPSVLLGAGLLAKNAVEKGLIVKPFVKTSFTPGSLVVDSYLTKSGLLPYLAKLGFQIAGHGCATCIGNSGPLPESINDAVDKGLIASAIISGNRNFEGRIHKSVKACYLGSPLLVIAYAIAGTINIDFDITPIGIDQDGKQVFLTDIFPDEEEIQKLLHAIDGKLYNQVYEQGLNGNEEWQHLKRENSALFQWDTTSSYLLEPPFVVDFFDNDKDIRAARVLALLGDSITTDHISPAGKIPTNSDTATYLHSLGCDPTDLNTYGARRGNHEAMVRGTFSNPRLKNKLAHGKDGGFTTCLLNSEIMTIYEASQTYQRENIPLIIIAGKQYGTGSSRDWAAKGPFLLGVRAVIAEGYERIHRSNLVMMGILPLQFMEGENADSLGIDGTEFFTISGMKKLHHPGQIVPVEVRSTDGKTRTFHTTARLDTPMEVIYLHHGGILPTMFKDFITRTSS